MDRWIIEDAPRPVEGSPEDLAFRERCRTLREGLERICLPILPGSPDIEDELKARSLFAEGLLAGLTVPQALSDARNLRLRSNR